MRAALLCLVPPALLAAGCTGTQVLNAFTPETGYRLAADVTYDRDHALALDVYSPLRRGSAPVVVFLYGGRWSSGAKEQYRFVGQALADQGFVAVIPEYRHYPEVRFPAFVHDAARAVVWTRQHAARYDGDPGKLFVMGHSSGAHMAAMLALNPEYLKEAGGERAWLRGMIGLAGAYAFLPITANDLRDMFGPPERFEASQPVSYADGDNPPLLLLHGENDDAVAVQNTRSLSAAVARAGGPVETVIYPEMSHSWIVATLAAPLQGRSDVLEQVTGFMARVLAGTAQPGAVQTQPRR